MEQPFSTLEMARYPLFLGANAYRLTLEQSDVFRGVIFHFQDVPPRLRPLDTLLGAARESALHSVRSLPTIDAIPSLLVTCHCILLGLFFTCLYCFMATDVDLQRGYLYAK